MLYSDTCNSNELAYTTEVEAPLTIAPTTRLRYDSSIDDSDVYDIGVPCGLEEFNDIIDLH